MKLLEKILVPVNLNTPDNRHLETAVMLASRFNSELILVSVQPDDAKKESVKLMINKHIESSLAEIAYSLKSKKIITTTRILYGNTFDQIISTSEDENVNLILIADNVENTASKYNIDVVA